MLGLSKVPLVLSSLRTLKSNIQTSICPSQTCRLFQMEFFSFSIEQALLVSRRPLQLHPFKLAALLH